MTLYEIDDNISEVEEQFRVNSASLCPNFEDELYSSDVEPDLLNEAVNIEYDEFDSDDEDDNQRCKDIENTED